MKKALFWLIFSFLVGSSCVQWRAIAPPPAITITNQSASTVELRTRATHTPSRTPITLSSGTPTTEPSLKGVGAGRQHIYALSEDISHRVAGSTQEAEAAQYIQRVFQDLGYIVQIQTFSLARNFEVGSANSGTGGASSQNVIAFKPGRSTREIVVGAHYDSTKVGKGADDNASGVGVLLEAARLVQGLQTLYSVRFIAFGAEEIDMQGSRYYVDHLGVTEIENILAMVNLDSLIAGDITYVYGTTRPKSMLRDWILDAAMHYGFEVQTQPGDDLLLPDGSPCDCSDYASFHSAGVPYVYFEATNWNLGEKDGYTQVDLEFGEEGWIWHTQFDRLDYIDRTFPGRVDEHLSLYVTLLFDVLTQFEETP